MSQEKSGFIVRYASPRSLLRDHASFFAKGGMIVPWAADAPPPSTPLVIRIQTPDGTAFDVAAKCAQPIVGHGFSVVFDPVHENRARAALDMFVKGAMFKRALDADKPTTAAPMPAEVLPFGTFAMGEATVAMPFVPPPQVADDDTVSTDDLGAAPSDDTDAAAGELGGEEGQDGEHLEDAESDDAENEDEESEDDDENQENDDAEPEEQSIQILPGGVEMPGPGESYPAFVIRFTNVKDFVELGEVFKTQHRLKIPLSGDPVKPGTVGEVRIHLPGHNIYRTWGIVESAGPGTITLHFDENNATYMKACVYLDSSQAKHRMKNEEGLAVAPPHVTRITEKMPLEDPNKMPIRRRLQRMGMEDKINMALSGGKEERMALAMDGNKAIHHYLLRNAKISLDEIAFMARLPTMNPDVLEKIAENPSYTQNPSVVKALIYNPKTPTPTAIRLLDRLPRQEVMNLAKRTNMNGRLVMAAKKKIEGRKI